MRRFSAMERKSFWVLLICAASLAAAGPGGDWPVSAADGSPLRVVTTLPDYAWLAREIGGDQVTAEAIVQGDQDPHFIRPRPSYAAMLRQADLFVTTGLDLELWLPAVLDRAGNRRILEGGPGYVAAAAGLDLLEVPRGGLSRSEGDVHVYGNPHITTDPLNMVRIARNILAGLERVDPGRAETYRRNEQALEDRLYRRLFGDWLVDRLGGETLAGLAWSGGLFPFLEDKEFQGERLIVHLGGWLGRAEPLRGRKIISYHKSWSYLAARFGLEFAGYVEPKPGIPPTPQHVQELIELIEGRGIRVILCENFFDPDKPRVIAERTGARIVRVPVLTGGAPGTQSYEELVDLWIESLREAFGVN